MFEKKLRTATLTMIAIFGLSNYVISIESEYNLINDVEPIDEPYLNPEREMLKHPSEPIEDTARPSTPEEIDISKLTPEDIKKLDEEINEWTPEQLSKLSPQQTAAITAVPLITLSKDQFLAVPTAHINPLELSQVFKYPSHIDLLPDSFVEKLTQNQAEAILDSQTNFLNTYFDPQQIEQIKNIAAGQPRDIAIFHKPTEEAEPATDVKKDESSTVTLSDFSFVEKHEAQEPMPTNKPSWWRKLSSTLSSVVDGLVKQFSRKSSLSIASDAMRQSARGTYDPKNDQAVDNAFRKLTTKQKDGVANDWLVQTKALFAEKNNILQKDIFHLSQVKSMPEAVREEQITALRKQMQDNDHALEAEINTFTAKMARYLSRDEKLIALKSPSGMIRFECIDMSEIDPTKSISDQKQKLKDDGIVNTYDADWWNGTTSTIHSQTLENLYTNWISDDIIQNFNPDKSITDQIEVSALKLTKHEWRDFDPSLQQAILDRVNDHLKTKLNIAEPTKEHAVIEDDIDTLMKEIARLDQEEAARGTIPTAKIDLDNLNQIVKQNGLLKVPAELIPHIDISVMSSLTPQDFSEITDEQMHALTRGQIHDLMGSQLAVVIPRLTSEQLSYVVPKEIEIMSKSDFDSMIQSLSPEAKKQLQLILSLDTKATPESQEEIQKLSEDTSTQSPEETMQHEPITSQISELDQLQQFAIHTSNQADQLATEIATNRYASTGSHSDLYTKDQTIDIYKKLFLEGYKNLYETLRDVPQMEHLSAQAYGDAVAKVLATISLKLPTITDIPKDSQTTIVQRYIAVKGI